MLMTMKGYIDTAALCCSQDVGCIQCQRHSPGLRGFNVGDRKQMMVKCEKSEGWSLDFLLCQLSDRVQAIPSYIAVFRPFGGGNCTGVQHTDIKICLAEVDSVLEGIAAYCDIARTEKRMLHAVGDGTFIVDGDSLDRREMMRSKLPDGV
jgi:hypothetical protein